MIYIFKIIYFYNTTIFLESTHGDLFKSVVAHRYTSMHTGKVCMWSSVPYILYGGKEGVGTRENFWRIMSIPTKIEVTTPCLIVYEYINIVGVVWKKTNFNNIRNSIDFS